LQFESWEKFWKFALRNLAHHLPNWGGAPLDAFWVTEWEGNILQILV